MIALMLLVIFAIVAIFLYSDVSTSGRLQEIKDVSAVQERKSSIGNSLTSSWLYPNRTPKISSETLLPGRFKGGQSLAKQLVVLLGTLVTAVSSFYFGSASVAAVTKQAGSPGGPDIKTVAPGC